LATGQRRKQENLRILLIFATCYNPVSKYGDFKKHFSKSVDLGACFWHKITLCKSCTQNVFSCQVGDILQNNNAGVRCSFYLFIYKIVLLIFFNFVMLLKLQSSIKKLAIFKI
jgi:hypothetical protein